MGPIALFDKSFLQSIGVDESLWFDPMRASDRNAASIGFRTRRPSHIDEMHRYRALSSELHILRGAAQLCVKSNGTPSSRLTRPIGKS